MGMYTRVVRFSKIAIYRGVHLTQSTLDPPNYKSPIGGVNYYQKSLAQRRQSLCTGAITDRDLKALVITVYVIKIFDFV